MLRANHEQTSCEGQIVQSIYMCRAGIMMFTVKLHQKLSCVAASALPPGFGSNAAALTDGCIQDEIELRGSSEKTP